MSTAGQSDAVATDDASASASAQTSAAQPTTSADSVSSASAAEPTSAQGNSQTSAAATSAVATQKTSAVQSSKSVETQASSAAASTNNQASSTQDSQPSETVASSEPAATETNKSSDDNNESTAQDNQRTTAAETSEAPRSTVVTVTNSSGEKSSVVVVITSTTTNDATSVDDSTSATSTSDSPALGGSDDNSNKGLSSGSKVAIGVVVPIAAIAIFALIGLFWWKKRRSRKQAEEERRKEVEDYAYNPNADPTVPSVMGDGYEMREDTSAGYRGWGSTTINSNGRKASTTMSGGQIGQAYSDVTSPTTTRGNMSDGRSNDPLMGGSYSPEGEILGAMGPNTANNRGADVHRGPSNASSSYSAARSDGSDTMGPSYGGAYYDQYAQNNPYDPYNPSQANAPVIRDNPARRNTRIENPSHYPQHSAGISQNF